METGRQFITTTPATNADRNASLGSWSRSVPRAIVTAALATCVLFFEPVVFAQPVSDSLGELLVGKAAFGDWRTDAPLVRRKITELPPPYATRSASNPPRVIPKPGSAAPKVPPGFQVELFVSNLRDPRMVRVAPNGDIFIAESEPGRIRVLRTSDREAQPSSNEVFASGLDQPFGISTRIGSAVDICRQYGICGPLSLSKRRPTPRGERGGR
jgi:glucose/arabinose dehydrogenase